MTSDFIESFFLELSKSIKRTTQTKTKKSMIHSSICMRLPHNLKQQSLFHQYLLFKPEVGVAMLKYWLLSRKVLGCCPELKGTALRATFSQSAPIQLAFLNPHDLWSKAETRPMVHRYKMQTRPIEAGREPKAGGLWGVGWSAILYGRNIFNTAESEPMGAVYSVFGRPPTSDPYKGCRP